MTGMSTRELKELLERVEDTRELVIAPTQQPQDGVAEPATELHAVWKAASRDATLAYDAWCRSPGGDPYAVYRAAADRADAAADALAAAETLQEV
jgi:hypothetical protein